MVELPTGSLIGLCIGCVVVGIIVGRTSKVMRRFATAHTRAHGGSAGAAVDATMRTGDQSVNVVVDAHGVRRVDGRYDVTEPAPLWDSEAVVLDEQRGAELLELVETGDEPALTPAEEAQLLDFYRRSTVRRGPWS